MREVRCRNGQDIFQPGQHTQGRKPYPYYVILLFSFILQALFASCIPEIIDLIGTRPKYGGTYKNERGRRHVIKLI